MCKNYCGRKGWSIKPPMWLLFNASCKIHDENYAIGGDWMDRWKYDHGFFRRMIKDCLRLRWFEFPFGIFHACLYYILVRIGGGFGGSFNYHQKGKT